MGFPLNLANCSLFLIWEVAVLVLFHWLFFLDLFFVFVFVLWWIELGQACFSSIHICLVLCLYTKFNLRFELLSPWIPLWSVLANVTSMLDYALCCPREYKPVKSTFLVTAPAHLLQIVFLVWGLAVNSLYICILCQSKDTIEELISKNISIQNRAIVDGFSKNMALHLFIKSGKLVIYFVQLFRRGMHRIGGTWPSYI